MHPQPKSILSIFSAFAAGLALCALLLSLAGSPAQAAVATGVWYVNAATGDDANSCFMPQTPCASIRAAVNYADAGDTIEIAAGVYHEHNIDLYKQLTLNGAGPEQTIVDAGAAGRIFRTGASGMVISGLRLQNGQTPAGDLFTSSGGAILVNGSLILQDVVLLNNRASIGGAIFNLGKLTLENSQVLSNTADGGGGAIYNYTNGVITITHSTLAYNSSLDAGSGGGGIYAGGKGLTIRSSTLAHNRANYFGGGLFIGLNGPVLLDGVTFSGNQAVGGAAFFGIQGVITGTNLTVSGNNASNNYGGIYLSGAGVQLLLQNSTIAYNTRTNSTGNGINGIMTGGGAVVSIVNTILAHNQQNNCSSFSPPTSLGHNLSSDFSCGLSQTGDQPGADPLLMPLADYGGGIGTHALAPGSPAIDAGDNSRCPAVDGRGVARPYDGDNDGQSVCDLGAVEARHQLTIADSTVIEGDSSAITAVFTVTLTPTSTVAVTVDYATEDGSAVSGEDYTAASGTLVFNPGQSQKTIQVQVKGDANDELDEIFYLRLSQPVNADLVDALAAGLIVDNDGWPTLSIADQSRLEGNSGQAGMQFVVTLSPSSTAVVEVDYATLDGTALAGSDYAAGSGSLTFQPGQTSKTIPVNILGDVVDEGDSESFTVQLSNPQQAKLGDGQATGTITGDDEARLTIQVGPQVVEGDSGQTPATFTVTLSTPAAFVVTVNFNASSSNSATPGEDYVQTSGTLTFQPGVTQQTLTVPVIGDSLYESDETFMCRLDQANVPISANVSFATILNDDRRVLYLPLLRR